MRFLTVFVSFRHFLSVFDRFSTCHVKNPTLAEIESCLLVITSLNESNKVSSRILIIVQNSEKKVITNTDRIINKANVRVKRKAVVYSTNTPFVR